MHIRNYQRGKSQDGQIIQTFYFIKERERESEREGEEKEFNCYEWE